MDGLRGRSERESCAGSAASPPHLGPGQVGAVAGPAFGGRAGGRRALGGSTARGAAPPAGPAPVAVLLRLARRWVLCE